MTRAALKLVAIGAGVQGIRPEPVGTAHHFAPKYVAAREMSCPCCQHRGWWIEARQARCGSCDTVLDIVRPLNPPAPVVAQPHSTQTMARIALLSLRARIKMIGL